MIPSAEVAAAISLPVSAVATDRRTAFEALYFRSSGLKLLVCTRDSYARRREILPAHLFDRSRCIGVIAKSSRKSTLSRIEEIGTGISQGPEGVTDRFGRPGVITIESDVLSYEWRDDKCLRLIL